MRIIIAAISIMLLGEGAPAILVDNTAQLVAASPAPADFAVRVERYAELHRRLERATPLVVSEDWSSIRATIDALADKIRAERANAGRGDVFTPEVERWFRHILADCDGILVEELLADMNEEEWEAFAFVPDVNQRWPEEAPLPTMPPHLLAVLPPLPPELEYRFVNRDLILWDARANLIVDYIEGVLPRLLRLVTLRDATNIPLSALKRHIDELPRDRNIVLYCGTGGRAGKAKEVLEAKGFKAFNGGGYEEVLKIVAAPGH